MFTLVGLACGFTGVGINSVLDQPWWVALIIVLSPTIVGVLWDILRYQGIKRGWFDKKTADKIEERIDDLTDDGKLNNSNKK